MNDFNRMSKTELRAYVLSHRQDEQAWNVYMERLKDDPTVIRIPPNLNDAGWIEVEQIIESHAQGDRS